MSRLLLWSCVLALTGAMSACSGCEDSSATDGLTSSTGSSVGGAGGDAFTVTSGTGGANNECTVACEEGKVCSHGVCVAAQACTDNGDCDFDTYCDTATGFCKPWDDRDPDFDEACVNLAPVGLFGPTIKCEFAIAPAGDPFPGHVDVQGTPVVVNFNDNAQLGPPSIAASFTATVAANYTEDLGVIRVLRGDTCALETNLGGVDVDGDSVVDWTVSSASLAVADLDGDSVAEIVAYGADGSTLAFTKKNGVWSLLWKAPLPAGAAWDACDDVLHRCSLGWAGPAIHDLDDDGVPEIIREATVFSATGALVADPPLDYGTIGVGLFPVLANLDQDPEVEMTNGAHVWEFVAGGWVTEPTFPASTEGNTAVADFGTYGSGLPTDPEIAIVRTGAVTVVAVDGSAAMPAVVIPGINPGGGPPTISDFDGDGLPEVGVAGRAYYSVFDIDCGPTPRQGGTCNLGMCDALGATCPAGGYILWSKSTQDLSSNVTGSSIFDFEADGSSEVVYGDECFVRVYNGKSGEVLFSQYRSSCTWNENPIIADTDGNFRADLVTPSNKACSPAGDGIPCQTLNADGVDPQWNGLRCEDASDCLSGTCDMGLCRCAATAECCAANDDAACIEAGLKCSPPNPGTPGTGNTCRASHPHGVSGIRVYSDANDRWVRSRTIWNQHAYAVTHINEDGTVPRTSLWMNNWADPTLNNFRQNVPGNGDGSAVPDSTVGAAQFMSCNADVAVLQVDVCNRGAAPVASGIDVAFYVANTSVCQAATTTALQPGECERVSCSWATPPNSEGTAVNVDVFVNESGAVTECQGQNNQGLVLGVFCKPPS